MIPTILQVAYPFAPVNADPVGGAEQVLAAVDRAVVEAGWRSLVIAAGGSTPASALLPIPAVTGDIDPALRETVHQAVRVRIAEAVARERIDLIHLHGIDFDAYLPPPGPPALATLHLPLDWYAAEALRPSRPRTWLTPVSARQAATAPAGVALTPAVENGVDVASFARRVSKRRFVLQLGRVCPEKGQHLALEAAYAADADLLLCGEVFPYAAHRAYFEDEVAPRLDARRRWIGPVAGARKRRLLAAARAVLIPSLAAETSSLVAREAAAAGTPVIAFRSGALVDAVEDGRTGFLVDDAAGMARAIGEVGRIDPAVCRSVAAKRFPLARMTDGYLALYRRLMATAA